MKYENDELVFSSGRAIYAFSGQIGLSLEGDDLELTYGYDGSISTPIADGWQSVHTPTPAECVELADAMLARWTAFRARYVTMQESA
jgi:hypothetical protein